MQLRDIQVGDIIEVNIPHPHGPLTQVQIKYIPKAPTEPWVVKEIVGNQRKWRIWTEGVFRKTMSVNR